MIEFFKLEIVTDGVKFDQDAIDTGNVELRIEIAMEHAITLTCMTASEICAIADGMIRNLEAIKTEAKSRG
jgi:hypothetical protein